MGFHASVRLDSSYRHSLKVFHSFAYFVRSNFLDSSFVQFSSFPYLLVVNLTTLAHELRHDFRRDHVFIGIILLNSTVIKSTHQAFSVFR